MNFSAAQRRLILVLGLAIAVGPMSIDMYLPGLPTLSRELAAGAGQAQLTLSAFFVGLALGQPIYGPLIDRLGRKRPLYLGLALYVLASLGCALATRIEVLLALRLLQALGGGAAMVVTRAVVRDLFDPQTAAKAFSLLMLVMGVAPILAPLAGGYLLLLGGWRAIFGVLAVFGVICLLAIWRALPETGVRDVGPRPGYRSVFAQRDFLAYALAGGLAQAGMFAYIAAAPFVFIEVYGVPAQHFGWLFGANAAGLIGASQLNRWLLGRYPLESILRGALGAQAVAAAALLAVAVSGGGLYALLLPLFATVATLGLVFPNTSAAAMAPFARQAGVAAASLGMLQYGCAALAGAAVGAWHENSARPMAVIIAVCSVSGWLLLRSLAPARPQALAELGR